MSEQKTHREVKKPQISARYLADFMAASETAKRRIVRDAKYHAIARIIQHDEAKLTVSKFVREGGDDTTPLKEAAQKIRDRMATSEFERDLFDHNADYIDRFAKAFVFLDLPDAEILAPGQSPAITLGGVRVTAELHFRLRRMTKTNKARVGASMLRYAKGKALASTVAEWQSAFLHGYLTSIGVEDGAQVENKLCITLDAYSCATFPAPTDSVSRFKNMASACATIAERWDNIKPPDGAVL